MMREMVNLPAVHRSSPSHEGSRRPRVIATWLLAIGLTWAPDLARADVVVTWMNIANLVSVKVDEANTRPRTPANSRSNAQVALAMFEAVNAVEGRYRSFLGLPAAPAGTSAEAAAASAAYTVLAAIFP